MVHPAFSGKALQAAVFRELGTGHTIWKQDLDDRGHLQCSGSHESLENKGFSFMRRSLQVLDPQALIAQIANPGFPG